MYAKYVAIFSAVFLAWLEGLANNNKLLSIDIITHLFCNIKWYYTLYKPILDFAVCLYIGLMSNDCVSRTETLKLKLGALAQRAERAMKIPLPLKI